jgi:hypothetical protein
MNVLFETYGSSYQISVELRELHESSRSSTTLNGRRKGIQMSIQEVSAEQLAELFHHYHQALGPDFGCAAKSTPESWDEVPAQERNRMVAAARLAILEVVSTTKEAEDSKRYFAKPGDAEWGC